MENEETAIDLKKQTVDWEVQCEQLKEEKVALEEEMLELKGREEKLEEKYLRRKEKHAELEKKFETEEKKWREEEEKIRERCRQLEVDKRKLEIDLREVVGSIGDGSDEVMDKLKAEVELLRSLLEQSRGRIITLLAKNDCCSSVATIRQVNGVPSGPHAGLRPGAAPAGFSSTSSSWHWLWFLDSIFVILLS